MRTSITATSRERIAYTNAIRVRISVTGIFQLQMSLGAVYCSRCVVFLQVPLRSIFLADVIRRNICIARTNRQCAYFAGAIVDCNSFTYVTMKLILSLGSVR